MDNELSTYLKKAGDEIFLSDTERAQMRHMIRAYMDMKPIRASATDPRTLRLSPLGLLFAPRPIAAILVLALFASSAGVSYAARSALPGDVFYAVKTQLNEPFEGALAVSESAKVAWAINVANTRIQEATTLAASGNLSTSTQQQLQANFEAHARVASEGITREASSSPEVGASEALQFEAQLSEYRRVLIQVAAAKDPGAEAFAASVEARQKEFAAIRSSAQRHIAAGGSREKTAAISHMRDAAKKQLHLSSDLARTNSRSLASSSARGVALRLAGASTTISDGEKFLDDNASPQALDAFESALTATEKIGVFLRTSSAIHERSGILINRSDQDEQDTVAKQEHEMRRTNGENGESDLH